MFNSILQIPLASAQITSTASKNVEKAGSATQTQITDMVNWIFTQVPLWITAAVVLVLTFVIARIVKGFVMNKLSEKGFDEENRELEVIAGRGTTILVLVMGITITLSIVGIDLAPIVAAAAFGIGFALKDLIMNLIAGMMILGAKHFKIGDTISVKGVTGVVKDIQTRATIIKAFDGTKVIMPNSDLFMHTVVNKWGNPYRKIKMTVGVEYQTDLVLAQKCIKKAISEIKWVVQSPKPIVKLWQWGESSINIMIAVWIDSSTKKYFAVRHALIHNVTEEFRKHGVHFAFPVYTNYNYDSSKSVEDLPNLKGGYLADNNFDDLNMAEQQPPTPPIVASASESQATTPAAPSIPETAAASQTMPATPQANIIPANNIVVPTVADTPAATA